MILVVAAVIVALGVCPLVLDLGLRVIRQLAPEFTPPAHPTLVRLDAGQPIGIVVWLWLSAAVVAPVAEEVFFRGLVQNAAADILRNRWSAILLTSVAFGLVHFPQPHAIVPLVVLGVILGYVYERTAALWAPVLVHVAFNLKTLIWSHFIGA
jgi:membrane protease YdiL (CAAX protease family)